MQESTETVKYCRGVTVKRRNGNGFEYDRFDIGIEGAREFNESIEQAYMRIRAQVHELLVKEIVDTRVGVSRRQLEPESDRVRREYGL